MKAQQPETQARRQASANAALARRLWRVFEYRRPPVPVRPRFTT